MKSYNGILVRQQTIYDVTQNVKLPDISWFCMCFELRTNQQKDEIHSAAYIV